MTKKMTATSLRNLMIAIVVLMFLGSIGGFYYAQSWLDQYATEISQTNSNSLGEGTDNNGQLQKEITRLGVVVTKAGEFTVSPVDYNSKISGDINKYASETGVTVKSVESANKPSTPIGMLQPKYLQITIENPVPYNNLLKFIKALETNVPKINLTGIAISHKVSDKDKVSVEPIVIEVFTQ